MAYPSKGICQGWENASYPCGSEVFTFSLTSSSDQAFETLVKLRKERILAAEELCYIYFQIQVRADLQYHIGPTGIGKCYLIGVRQQIERAAILMQEPNFDSRQPRLAYGDRLPKLLTLTR